jgi:DNA-binding protein HU-beta
MLENTHVFLYKTCGSRRTRVLFFPAFLLRSSTMPTTTKKPASAKTAKKPTPAKKPAKAASKAAAPKKPRADKALTKTQVVAELAEMNALTRKQAQAFLESFVELAYRETKKYQKFAIPGVGILKLNKRKARIGRNPATGESIKIPAKTVVKCAVSKACKEAILGPMKK